MNSTQQARVIHFYGDCPVGTTGEVVKQWTDPDGNRWTKLYFGRNQGGQRLTRSFPDNVLETVRDEV